MKTLQDIVRNVYQRLVEARAASTERTLALLRWGILLVASTTIPWTLKQPDASPWLIATLFAIGASYCAYMSIARPMRTARPRDWGYYTITWQGVMPMLWISATGGIHSPFFVISYVAVVAASFRFTPRQVLYCVLLHSMGYTCAVALKGQLPAHLTELVPRVMYMFLASALGALAAHELLKRSADNSRAHRAVVDDHTRRYLAQIVETSGDAIIGLSVAGDIESWNPAAETIYGYGREEALGKPIAFLAPKDAHQETLRTLSLCRQSLTVQNAQLPWVRKDGREITVSFTVSPVRDPEGKLVAMSSISRDISAQEEARRRIAFQARLMANVSDAVIATDTNLTITYWNDAAQSIYGWSAAEATGRVMPELLATEFIHSSSATALNDLREKGRLFNCEVTQRRKDGSVVYIETGAIALRDDRGEFVGAVSVNRDVTERRLNHEALARSLADTAKARDRERARADDLRKVNELLEQANRQIGEEQLKVLQNEKLASIGLLAAGVAHEINNPLMGISACVTALRNGNLPEDRHRHYLEVIDEALSRMGTTVQALLGYARHKPDGTTQLDARAAVAACLPLIAQLLREKRVVVDLSIEAGEATLLGNASQLAQASMNVLLNAIHASPPGGKVAVWCTHEAERVGLHFKDHGPGIPKKHLRLVCDPFFTTKPEGQGTGLGLSVTQGIVKNHGGELVIASEEGAGTTVTFWLPKAAATPALQPEKLN